MIVCYNTLMKTINEDIKTRQFKRVYVLYGEEDFLKQSLKRSLYKAIAGDDTMNVNSFEGKSIDVRELISLADTMPFFAERRLIVVEGSGFFKSSQDELADYIANVPDTTTIVFVEEAVDKRNRFYKECVKAGYAAELKTPDEKSLSTWAAGILKRDGKKITMNTMNIFLEKTGEDMNTIKSELEKLIAYVGDREIITDEDVAAITTTSVTGQVFEMVGAMVSGNVSKALNLYHDLLTLREPSMRILFLIGRQFNQLMLVKELAHAGKNKNDVASALKISPYIAGKLMTQARPYSYESLRSMVELCVQSDEDVKSGRLDDRLAVEMLICKRLG